MEAVERARGALLDFEQRVPGESPLYSHLAGTAAGDPDLVALAARVPHGQPVPNVFFAAVQYLLLTGAVHPLAAWYPSVSDGPPPAGDPFPDFRDFCLSHAGAIAALCSTRLTQTNEVGRCTALLPALGLVAALSRAPLAILEVGASAGLLLLFDRYGYAYRPRPRMGRDAEVVLGCDVVGDRTPPIPDHFPEVAWRMGIDVNPIDVADADATRWLSALIWPEHVERRRTLAAALRMAAGDPPRVVRGDASSDLPGLIGAVPSGTALCVVHSQMLNQVPPEGRVSFHDHLLAASRDRAVYRVSMEWLALGTPEPRLDLITYRDGAVLDEPLAFYHHHGRWIRWLH